MKFITPALPFRLCPLAGEIYYELLFRWKKEGFRWDEGYQLARGWWRGTDAHPVLNASCHPQLDILAIYWLP